LVTGYLLYLSIYNAKKSTGLIWLEEVPFGLIDDDDYIIKCSKRSFVAEELMVIPYDIELPPQWMLTS
jgi:hypothetical protein